MNITRLQLLDSDVKGFLNIKGDSKVPLTFSVSDIRDISSRSGMFSKTINLTGDKNNNNILNNYFDVNIVAGTFDVNKRQKVAIVQNGVILRDNCFMRLLKVVKKQSVDSNIDEWVEYEVQVTDELGDFFKEVGNKEIKELDGWSKYKHTYGVDAVVDSFDHTEVDGYKYTLPFIEENPNVDFVMNDLMPGVYAKQIFDRIHSMNGFNYEWSTIADEDTQFDKSILPYAGDKKKLTDEYIESVKVIADSPSAQETGKYILGNGINNGQINSTPLSTSNEIKDNSNLFNHTTSIYSNSLIVEAPNTLNYIVKINYDIFFVNDYAYDISLTQAYQRFTSNLRIIDTNGSVLKHTNRLPLEVNPSNSSISQYGTSGDEIRISHLVGQSWNPGETVVANGNQTFDIPITSLVGTEELRIEVNASMNNSAGSQWRRTGTFDAVDMKMKIVIKSIEIEIAPGSQNGLMPGTEIDIKNFLPTKMKQSEFLKTIYQKYNLYVEVDPNEPSKLVYTSRDKFYDDGIVKDWTEKLDKKKEQELYFIPDITTKSMILSYMDDDKDALLDAYRGETSKTFGQVKVTFDNENIKGEERKDEVFSPTISMETHFGAVLPVLNADFKMNQRILQDGGKLPCQTFKLKESDSKTITSSFYPHLSMFNRPFNPTFSTEYAQSSFYGYNPQLITENNLYTLHWRRTLAQINSGKMLKAWFWLTEEDIQGLRMNDKIKVNNALYYINAVIDYDANSLEPTKVELLTVEDDLKLPRIGGGIKNIETIVGVVDGISRPKIPSTPGGFFVDAISRVIKKRYDENVVVSGPTPLTGNLGMGNTLPGGFRGVIIGDNLKPNQDGIFVGESTQITEGGIKSNSLEVPGLTISEDGNVDFSGAINVSGDIEVDSIKINNIGATTPIGNLGYDVDGNVVFGIAPGSIDRLPISLNPSTYQTFSPPSHYINNYSQSIYVEIKSKTALDATALLPVGVDYAVITQVDYATTLLRLPTQTVHSAQNNVSIRRYALDDINWGAWSIIGGGGGSMTITPITYAALKALKTSNSLAPGVRYFISDRDIWIDALDTDKLAMECKRHFRIVKDEYYTPHTVGGIGNNLYLGIYGQTISKGSVPNSSSVAFGNRYYAIWGGRMWQRNTTGSDTPGSSNETIAGGWTLQATTNDLYYESKIFDIKYNFDDDRIWEQSDDRGNKIKRISNITFLIDITDWGNSNISNNENFGIFNNFRNATTKAFISFNLNNGGIYNNSNNGDISYNSNNGAIFNNSNNGHINNNSNNGHINNNSNGGSINNNSNNGLIQLNSNNGFIFDNSNSGSINNNSNISGTTNIQFNTNTGWIRGNRISGTYLLQYNTNNGNIGVGSGTITRIVDITDTQVNK